MTSRDLTRLVDALLAESAECEWLEFKLNLADPKKIGETLSAISNSAFILGRDSGYMVWGIDDRTRHISGTSFSPRKQKIGEQQLENWLATMLSPRIQFDIHEFSHEGKPLVVFRIQPAPGTPVRFQSAEWIRVGSYNQPLRDFPEHERRLWIKSGEQPFEKRLAVGGISAADTLALLDYRKYFDLVQLPVPSDELHVLERLLAEKLVVESGGRYGISNLGALAFAHRLSSFDFLARKAVRLVRYGGNDRTAPAEQTLFDAGYAAGFEDLIVSVNRILPAYESIGTALRQWDGYPPLAIRELIANAMIHQDLSVAGASPLVEIFPGRVEISNPGKPLISPERFIDEAPRSRNDALAFLLRRLRICEELGTGIDKVIREIERNRLPPPYFQARDASTCATLYARKPLKDMDSETRIRACYQHACLQYVSEARVLTNASLRQRFGIDSRNAATASRIIRDTLRSGLIRSSGSGGTQAGTQYVPAWA